MPANENASVSQSEDEIGSVDVGTGAEHSADVGVPLVESLLDDGVHEGRAVEEEALVALSGVLVGHFATPVRVALPQPPVAHLLDLHRTANNEQRRYRSVSND